jgi:hypothetical protein
MEWPRSAPLRRPVSNRADSVELVYQMPGILIAILARDERGVFFLLPKVLPKAASRRTKQWKLPSMRCGRVVRAKERLQMP